MHKQAPGEMKRLPAEEGVLVLAPTAGEAALRPNGVSAMPAIRVMLVDDHPMFRAGIRALLQTVSDVEIVAEAGDGREALRLIMGHRPDVVLMDLLMPGLNGLDATA